MRTNQPYRRFGWSAGVAVALALLPACFGCGGSDSANSTARRPDRTTATPVVVARSNAAGSNVAASNEEEPRPPIAGRSNPAVETSTEPESPPPPTPRPGRSLADLLVSEEDDAVVRAGPSTWQVSLRSIDDERVASKGIRKLTGKHLVLYTDLASAKEVDELPGVFDLAVPQWCRYFDIDPAKVEHWRMIGFLIKEKARFRAAGLLEDDLPPFLYGYQRRHELWVYEQPSAYYRRHLLLHEGTHAFMFWQLGGSGPPWYSEGMAELLGTHRWQDGELTLGYFPQSRDDTPQWGRIKIVRDEYQAKRAMGLTDIMKYDARAHLRGEPYGWCWAAAAFFDAHPQTQAVFRQLRREAPEKSLEFSRRFYQRLTADWPQIVEQWQLFVVELDYGYDVARAAIDYQPGRPLPAGGAEATIRADKGWQSSGIRLEAGVTYRIGAAGRYQIGRQPKPWWCEPGGVTIRYHDGRPLGMLLAAVRDDQWKPKSLTPLASPVAIGLGREIKPPHSGTLYLRVNESSGGLADNSGQLTVRVSAP